MSDPHRDKRREIASYILGYGAALALTALAFATVHWSLLDSATTLSIVFVLGLAQAAVHFRCFLHISLRKSSREDLQLILFSTLIVTIMVLGTVVVMTNMRHRMM